jgi:hypothetical protein
MSSGFGIFFDRIVCIQVINYTCIMSHTGIFFSFPAKSESTISAGATLT